MRGNLALVMGEGGEERKGNLDRSCWFSFGKSLQYPVWMGDLGEATDKGLQAWGIGEG